MEALFNLISMVFFGFLAVSLSNTVKKYLNSSVMGQMDVIEKMRLKGKYISRLRYSSLQTWRSFMSILCIAGREETLPQRLTSGSKRKCAVCVTD